MTVHGRDRIPTKAFWNAYGMLMGKEEVVLKKRTKKPKNTAPSEASEQMRAVIWLDKNGIIFYHIPNGGYRNAIEGAKFKRLGVKSGIPDLCIPISRKGYHGLYIELKRLSGGSVSDSQKYWLSELKKQGYDVFIAKGAEELINYVKNYLGV